MLSVLGSVALFAIGRVRLSLKVNITLLVPEQWLLERLKELASGTQSACVSGGLSDPSKLMRFPAIRLT